MASQKRGVKQFTLSGEYIKTWESVKGAAKELGIHPAGIRNCADGSAKSAGGFRWEYEDER